MLSRRSFLVGSAAGLPFGLSLPANAATKSRDAFFRGSVSDGGFSFRGTNFSEIDKRWKRQLVQYYSPEPVGSVVVDTKSHFLYLIFENQTALRYGVGVGKEGFKWYGRAKIMRKAKWPRWVPPPEMRARKPELPEFMDGGPENPLGPRALYLFREKRDLGYRIHGTTEPWSIGSDASSGCIRMFSEDVIDLYQRCPIGTRVLVLKHLGAPVLDEAAPVDQ